jgi:hypothetical protein
MVSAGVLGRLVRPRLAGVAIVLLSGVLLGFPCAAQAKMLWSAPIQLFDAGAYPHVMVACPSVSQCTAVDIYGYEVTFDPGSPGTPTPTMIDESYPDSLACPSATQCTAVDELGGEVTFDPASPGSPTPVTIDSIDAGERTATNGLVDVACPSVSQCTAVDSGGYEVTFNPLSPGTLTFAMINANPPQGGVGQYPGSNRQAVACPSVRQCTVVDSYGHEVTFNPLSPGTPVAATVDSTSPDSDLEYVACPSVKQCTEVQAYGPQGRTHDSEVTFNPLSPRLRNRVRIDKTDGDNNAIAGLACPSSRLCVAVDSYGRVLEGDPTTREHWRIKPIVKYAPNLDFGPSLSCSSTKQCVVVDSAGQEFVGGQSGPSGPATSERSLGVSAAGTAAPATLGAEPPAARQTAADAAALA